MAFNTYRETVRDRVLINILLFAIVLLLSSLVVGEWTLGQQVKVMKDFGLSAMSIFGLLIAIFIGIRLMVQEMEQRTIYLIASKPIHRWEIVIGKFSGLALTLAINIIVMSITLALINLKMEHRIDFDLVPAIVLIYLEILIMVAFSMLFSAFTSPTLSAVGTLIVFSVGHLSNFIYDYLKLYPDKGFHSIFKVMYYIVPNLEKLNMKTAAASGYQCPPNYFIAGLIYGCCYTLFLLILTSLIFSRRDLK
jgi:ABC-type transport system involved in multi-copper enzyme maturation permease subunit